MTRLLPKSPLLLLGLLLAGCPADPYASPGSNSKIETDAAKRRESPTAAKADTPEKKPPEFVAAGTGAADEVVRDAMHTASARGQRSVVYVGASWCEPCTAFHHALERGELDEALAGVQFIEFDADNDGARLRAAGYSGRLIPRFVIPGPDGRASAARIEGGIKGAGAVDNIMERLGPLLSPPMGS